MNLEKSNANVIILDDMDAETIAMLQAMYSRSSKSVVDRIAELIEEGGVESLKEKLQTFYLGYGHRSIADCGFETVFLEGLSIIATKAIQDTGLFNGQECSTRYLNFEDRPIHDPYGREASAEIIFGWLKIYSKYLPKVISGLTEQHPRKEDEAIGDYERAIRARAFDIMRCILPAAVTTQTSWTGSLRTLRERCIFLTYHPLAEVRMWARKVHETCLKKYPNSFAEKDMLVDVESEEYKYYSIPEFHYMDMSETDGYDEVLSLLKNEEPYLMRVENGTFVNNTLLDAVATRPARAFIPKIFAETASFNFLGLLDYGSFRDIQRHRNGFCPIPVLKDYGAGINAWYLKELFNVLSREDSRELVADTGKQFKAMKDFFESLGEENCKYKNQYLYPLGMNVVFQLNYDTAQCAYVSELRSTPAVHDTLRPFAIWMGKSVNSYYEDKLICRFDDSPSAFNVARGKQTIFQNGEEIK